MASREQPFKKMMQNWYIKDELSDIPTYAKEKNIEHHIKIIKEKFDEIDLPTDQKAKYTLKSLSEDALLELKSLRDYESKKNDFKWICDALTNLFKGKHLEVTSYLNLLRICQKPGETLRNFLSRVRSTGYNYTALETGEKREQLLLMVAFINGLLNKKPCNVTDPTETLNSEGSI